MKNTQDVENIIEILAYRREHTSKGEQYFIDRFLSHTTPILSKTGEVIAYKYSNYKPGAKNNVLWTSHIDTMHHGRPDQISQEVYVDSFNIAFVNSTEDCLGSDDGSGVWIMLEMIKADVHGTYMFFRGEEKGCIGSRAFAEEYADELKTYTHAIAFDRKGKTDVITHQQSSRCCSDKFAKKMSTLLGGSFSPCDSGVYTDTAEFTHLVPECTNIAVGYIDQHTSKETQDLDFLVALKEQIIQHQWEDIELPVERKPEAKQDRYSIWEDDYGYSPYDNFILMSDSQRLTWVTKQSPLVISDLIKDLATELSYAYEGGALYSSSYAPFDLDTKE